MKPVFIFSAPRSGSTLAMRILNLVPGVAFSGESGGVLQCVISQWNHLRTAEESETRPRDPAAMAARGTFVPCHYRGDREAFRRALNMVLVSWAGAKVSQHRHFGWKETLLARHGNPWPFEYLHEIAPDARLVFLFRPAREILASLEAKGWPTWYQREDHAVSMIARQQDAFAQYLKNPKGSVSRLNYRDLADGDALELSRAVGFEVPTEAHQKALACRTK